MRSYRLGLDRMTGDIIALGRDGRRYTITELEHAEDGALRGDPVALEVIRQVELASPGAVVTAATSAGASGMSATEHAAGGAVAAVDAARDGPSR
jgi:hypothetical protein